MPNKQIHPEFAELLEKAKHLTPEQIAELEKGLRDQREAFRWLEPLLRARVVGATTLGGWTIDDEPRRIGRFVCDNLQTGARVIISGGRYADGKRWIHLSFSYADRIPSWEELKEIKTRFLGDDCLAVQVFPPKSEWVNVHEFCLHLWRCVDGDPVPDFRQIVGEFKSI